jgi:hypothetical protein
MTPFIYAGDLNLVGYAQQLESLRPEKLTISINLVRVHHRIGMTAPSRMNCVFRQTNGWPIPGVMISVPTHLEDSILSFTQTYVLNVEKSYVLQTEVMPEERLNLYELQANDTGNASDHFPVVTDFTMTVVDQTEESTGAKISVFPNPVVDELIIELPAEGSFKVTISNVDGKNVLVKNNLSGKQVLSVGQFPTGIYFLRLESDEADIFNQKIIRE